MTRYAIIFLAAAALAHPLVDSDVSERAVKPQFVAPKQMAPAQCAVTQIKDQDGIGAGQDKYVMYNGDGTSQHGWPDRNKWVSFQDMYKNNVPLIRESCAQFHVPNNNDQEMAAIYNGIEQVAMETHVDHRFILATMMQESKGCVRAPTTNYGVRNPGLMQSHDGAGTCNDGGRVQNPCPESEIIQMIRDGVGGTAAGDGWAGLLSEVLSYGGGGEGATYYRAARKYNSGSLDGSGDLGKGIATHCYASDIANRMTGWVHAASTCHLDG